MIVGALLRLGSLSANIEFPHGDVHLDAATARSLATGRGFWTPWEEGSSFRPDAISLTNEGFGHAADQHGPLWPLIGAPLTWLTRGDAVLALQIASLIAGILTIPIAYKVISKFNEKAAVWFAWACALCLPLCDYSGNGSLYAAQVFGILALFLVARDLKRSRDALYAGICLGALFLLNYQCIVIIPAFALAAVWSLGISASVRPLSIAAAACVAATTPWFIRNYLVFNNPFYNSNIEFVVHQLAGVLGEQKHLIDTTGERILLTSTATPADFWAGVKSWTFDNFCYWIVTMHLALPVLPFFALGGFQRMLMKREDGTRPLVGALFIFSFLGLLLISSVWPTPKARYLVPMITLAAGAGMYELVAGARFIYAAISVILTLTAAKILGLGLTTISLFPWIFIQLPKGSSGFPNREMSILLFTLLIPLISIVSNYRKFLPAIALAILALHGAFRVTISLNKELCAQVFGIKVEGKSMFGPATATFYEILGGPFIEGFELRELFDLKRGAIRLKETEAVRAIAPVEFSYFWDGQIVSMPSFAKRFDLNILPKTLGAFQADALVVPLAFYNDPTVRERLQTWCGMSRALRIYGPEDSASDYAVFYFPKEK